jgi:formylglycine-generating enzyme required for sulfatase activity
MAKKPANNQRAAPKPAAGDKAAKAGTPKPPKGSAKGAAATRVSASVAPAGGLGKADVKKIQEMLKSKTADDVSLGLSLLESLGATQADYEAVFTGPVIKSVLKGWVAASWGAVAILKILTMHDAVSESFHKVASELSLQRPRNAITPQNFNFSRLRSEQNRQRLADIVGEVSSRLETVRLVASVRPSFIAKWDDSAKPTNPFIELVNIASGSFTMGSPPNEANRGDDEIPVTVRITKPFAMGRSVVTQGQWRAVMGSEPWRDKFVDKNQFGNDFPAVGVSWVSAALFCLVITDLEREVGRLLPTQAYRLPTEAEWEYACRAGTTAAYSFGDDPEQLGEYAWYAGNSKRKLHKVAGKMDGWYRKKPNAWGLFDMHGNVEEWCSDWYDATLIGGDNPVGPSAGSIRVSRGGSFEAPANYCRSACRRQFDFPYQGCGLCGFRVVLE